MPSEVELRHGFDDREQMKPLENIQGFSFSSASPCRKNRSKKAMPTLDLRPTMADEGESEEKELIEATEEVADDTESEQEP